MPESSTYKGLDLFKLVMAFFIVAIHSGLFTDLDGELAFVTIQVFARMGVPFFFIASGFFFSKGLAKRRSEAPAYLGRYEKKLLGLFAFWSLVMLAFWVRNGLRAHGFGWEFALRLAQTIAFDPGVFWYLLALVVSSLFAYPFIRRGKGALLFAIACLFYVFGCFGDSYYGLVKDVPVLGDLYRAYFSIFVHARHGLPFGLFFFSLGHLFARDEGKLALRKLPLLAVFTLSLALRYLELRFLRERGWALDNSISLFAALPAVLLFLLAYNLEPRIGDEASRGLRTLSSTIFFSHQLMLELVILFVELSRIQVTASLRFLVASLLCVLLFLAVRAGRSEFLKRMING